jgi:hypothetical protein
VLPVLVLAVGAAVAAERARAVDRERERLRDAVTAAGALAEAHRALADDVGREATQLDSAHVQRRRR